MPKEAPSALTVMAARPPLIAGESPTAFQREVEQLAGSLESNSPLVPILCEQLVEAVWWCRRHQEDKWRMIVRSMVGKLCEFYERGEVERDLEVAILGEGDKRQQALLDERLEAYGYTLPSLRAVAVKVEHKAVADLDRLVDRQLKTIRQLQKSIDEVVAKPLVMRRLKLQIEQLERDLNAIDHDQSSAA